ncbi:hypothetical protein [Chryseobacterium sp. OV279]|uniref:hypothetical protein n=1 Tax=Chryseobacterium sp. OV279 TaxID=1500285 RepID=UPI0009168D1C|nr:hypothetical protein [Chryseobacterium sp. OV279]SHG41316.1 hypothetical protein SAMN02787100_4044 [Chryseobacterium sp. OV279]
MLRFLFKNKLSVFGSVLVVGSVIVLLYNYYKLQHLISSIQTVEKVYIEKEKTESEFKYGKTNLNINYLYIESESTDHRFYSYENTGKDLSSQDLEKAASEIPAGSKISIWVDEEENKDYKDVEIQKLKIDGNTVINNPANYLYLVLSMIIGLLFLLISRKYA